MSASYLQYCPEGWQAVPKTVTPEMADAYASDAYDTAQQCHDAVLGVAPHPGDADEAINSNPDASLTRRDLLKQAEALEDAADEFEVHERARQCLKWKAEKLRQRAQELTE